MADEFFGRGHGGIDQGAVHGQASPSSGQIFCSEFCFSQCRRAAFKRAKVCDWCKHVRHTVSYVEVHEGDRQLQFCGDKCLNQYKMQLFCKEATSLGMAPKSGGQLISDGASSSTSPLITPELWLRNCHSPENLCERSDSTDSDPDGTLPLNYSMRNVPAKRPSDQTAEAAASKKGKSHRKVSPVSTPKHPQWPVLPHPAFLPPSLIGFHNQLIRFNLNENKVQRRPIIAPPAPSLTQCRRQDQVQETNPTMTSNRVHLGQPEAKSESLSEKLEVPKTAATVAPHVVLSPYPLLVPLPIPVPIPIPINIHEKYLKCLTS